MVHRNSACFLKTHKSKKTSLPPLEDRFRFLGDALAPEDREALRSAVFEVEDKATGIERTLKLWRKTGGTFDGDLRRLWLHEMRQVQRLSGYAGARETIVDVLELVEDDEWLGVLLERTGRPLGGVLKRVKRDHWLKKLDVPRNRSLFWRNIQRLVRALGIIHAQGLVHGNLTTDVVMTEAGGEADFQLSGFEWSLWVGGTNADQSHANLSREGATRRAEAYSFEDDWRCLGELIAACLSVNLAVLHGKYTVEPSADLTTPEFKLLKRLIAPSRLDLLDALAIGRSIDDIVAAYRRGITTSAGSLILGLKATRSLGNAVYDVSGGLIAVDEFRRQLEWVEADLREGATLLVPNEFDTSTSALRLVTDNLIYTLAPFLVDGSPEWDIAVCVDVRPRTEVLRRAGEEDHEIVQPILPVSIPIEAKELRAKLGSDALDWSAFAGSKQVSPELNSVTRVKKALLLIQAVEAIVKALETYPIEVFEEGEDEGGPYAIVGAEPFSDRDHLAERIGLSRTSAVLVRFFEEDQREFDGKWRISQSHQLGASLQGDVRASFIEVTAHEGRPAYRFQLDESLPAGGPFFLRTGSDTGTEKAISRRLKNIKALDTRVDLAEMLEDPWRVRRDDKAASTDQLGRDEGFVGLDALKRKAIREMWAARPAYFVVGPPGVGKTKLATEAVRLRFSQDKSTRLLVTAQGHDALDALQVKINDALDEHELRNTIIVRTTTPEDRPTSDDEAHVAVLSHLRGLASSKLAKNAPSSLRSRIDELAQAATKVQHELEAISSEDRSGLHAVSRLLLDAANIVITTVNSKETEQLVDERASFDWVMVEEAAKATGPELVGPLMLSGRHLLIGDHNQLPPFGIDRLSKIISDLGLLRKTLSLKEQLIGPLMQEGELDEVSQIEHDDDLLEHTASLSLRLLEPFKTFVTEDEQRTATRLNHRPLSTTLTEQRRMDPAIATVVSRGFYKGKLTTEKSRAELAETVEPPFSCLSPLSVSPVVVVDFPHVSSTGRTVGFERGRPQWSNPYEVSSVIDVLRHIRARSTTQRPTLAIISPYNAQVRLLRSEISKARSKGALPHLRSFTPVRSDGDFVGTVDAFQGNEADLVVLSLVRNNPRTGYGALGFLRDSRRMNVALSRAKWKLVIVGSLSFLLEAERGVNPDAAPHELSFLPLVVSEISSLSTEARSNGTSLASIVPPVHLGSTR